jgi:hypothetical protein
VGTFDDNYRNRSNVATRNVIALDIEQRKDRNSIPIGCPAPSLDDTLKRIEQQGWAAGGYTTHSHKPGEPRYRVVIMLSREVIFPSDPNKRSDELEIDALVVRLVAKKLELTDCLDASKCGAESAFYLPRHTAGDEHFLASIVQGEPLDYALFHEKARREWERENKLRARAMTHRPQKRHSLIVRFNKKHDVVSELMKSGYARRGSSSDHWRSPRQTTGSYATRVCGDRWVSLSASDIDAGLGRKTRAGNACFGDAFDLYCFREHGGNVRKALAALRANASQVGSNNEECGVTLRDFVAYMPMHNYIYIPTREAWPATSVNARIPPIKAHSRSKKGENEEEDDEETAAIPANVWLDRNQPVEQAIWAPGQEPIVENRLMADGGWFEKQGARAFNLYRPPTLTHGDPSSAGPWLELVRGLFREQIADHVLNYLAFKVQNPGVKINHALVIGGEPGIGKDTFLEPVKHAVGPWNFQEISPKHLVQRFNSFTKSVLLRISEARDLGEVSRYDFYEHMKTYAAAPPDVHRCDEKHLREHYVMNVCGVLITTNYKTTGLYLPPEDRRHFVAWSYKTKEEFAPEYWNELWGWYNNGGFGHVAAYLATRNLSAFDPKKPPPKTPEFWEMVDANRPTEDAELADCLDDLGRPDAVTVDHLKNIAQNRSLMQLYEWLSDRRFKRLIPSRMGRHGYVRVRNTDSEDGLFKIDGRRQVAFAKAELPPNGQKMAVGNMGKPSRTKY